MLLSCLVWLKILICVYCCSYQWIQRKGKPTPREIAPIVVSNHVSYIDPIFFFYELFPTIVASDSHDSMPLVGTIIRAMQVPTFLFPYVSCYSLYFFQFVYRFLVHSLCFNFRTRSIRYIENLLCLRIMDYNHMFTQYCYAFCCYLIMLLNLLQVIYVNRFSPSSRKNAVNEIKVLEPVNM